MMMIRNMESAVSLKFNPIISQESFTALVCYFANLSILGHTPFSGKLQGAGPVGLGGDHGDAHLLWPHLRRGEGRQPRRVHILASGSLLGHHHHDLCEYSPKRDNVKSKVKTTLSIICQTIRHDICQFFYTSTFLQF